MSIVAEVFGALVLGLGAAVVLLVGLAVWALAGAYRQDDEDARAWLVPEDDE